MPSTPTAPAAPIPDETARAVLDLVTGVGSLDIDTVRAVLQANQQHVRATWEDLVRSTRPHATIAYQAVNRAGSRVAQPDLEDLSLETADGYAAIEDGNGPILAADGYDHHEPDEIRHVAEWWDRVAEVARDIGNELRDEANAVCEECRGLGVIAPDSFAERECVRCAGHGTVS